MPKTITISDETYDKIKGDLSTEELVDISTLQDFVGKKLFIRTVTYHFVGKVEKVLGNLLELSTASWVADSGRYMQAIKDGNLHEVEPIGQTWLNTQTFVEITPWNHDLPTKQS